MAEYDRERSSWYHSMPWLTRIWFTACIIVPVLVSMNAIYWADLTLDFTRTFHQKQLWRLVTAFVYYPISRTTLITYLLLMYLLYHYSRKLESDSKFAGRPADYLFMLLFNWGCLVGCGLYFDKGMLMAPMVLSVVQVWCQLHRNVIVDLWFGHRFRPGYFPYVYIPSTYMFIPRLYIVPAMDIFRRFRTEYIPLLIFATEYLIGTWDMFELTGIVVGHLFYLQKCNNYLSTPAFLYHWLPNTRGLNQAQQTEAPEPGHRLGGRSAEAQ